jgi:hypothetical protein
MNVNGAENMCLIENTLLYMPHEFLLESGVGYVSIFHGDRHLLQYSLNKSSRKRSLAVLAIVWEHETKPSLKHCSENLWFLEKPAFWIGVLAALYQVVSMWGVAMKCGYAK